MASTAVPKLIDIFSWCLAYDLKGYKGILGRYQHRDTILNPVMTIKQIAEQLKITIEEIHNARKALRRKLKIEETIGQGKIEKWVLQHAIPLTNLKIKQLQQEYQISKEQIKYRRILLKKLQSKI